MSTILYKKKKPNNFNLFILPIYQITNYIPRIPNLLDTELR